MAKIPECDHLDSEEMDPDCASCVVELLRKQATSRIDRFERLIRLDAPANILIREMGLIHTALTDLERVAAGFSTTLPYGREEPVPDPEATRLLNRLRKRMEGRG